MILILQSNLISSSLFIFVLGWRDELDYFLSKENSKISSQHIRGDISWVNEIIL